MVEGFVRPSSEISNKKIEFSLTLINDVYFLLFFFLLFFSVNVLTITEKYSIVKVKGGRYAIMIKLVLSDLDGTLLKKGEKQINHIILNLIKCFSERGIKFAVSSGRSYSEMREIMRYTDDIYYICSDGATIVYNSEVLFKKCIDDFAIKRVFDKKNIVFHGVDFVKYNNADEELQKILKEKYGEKAKKTEDVNNLKEIIKLSKYGAGFMELPPFSYEIYKDKEWCEWINNGAGKGKATEFLQNLLNISIRETAAFGDNYNDVGMFQRAAEKYVMDSAPSSVKMISNHRVSDIERELNDILKEKDGGI